MSGAFSNQSLPSGAEKSKGLSMSEVLNVCAPWWVSSSRELLATRAMLHSGPDKIKLEMHPGKKIKIFTRLQIIRNRVRGHSITFTPMYGFSIDLCTSKIILIHFCISWL